MNHFAEYAALAAISMMMLSGCGGSSAEPAVSGPKPNVHLSQEPAGAIEVLDAR